MPSINIEPGYFRHIKTRRLKAAVGLEADVYPIRLWGFLAEFDPDGGCFGDMSAAEVEAVAEWRGPAGDLAAALERVCFLDRDEEGRLCAHDWHDHEDHLRIYRERSEKANQKRWSEKHNSKKDSMKESLLDSQCSAVTRQCNAVQKDREAAPEDCIDPKGILALWNAMAHPNLSRAETMAHERLRHARSRIAEQPTRAYWVRVIQRVNASSFCRGESDRGWKADLDFILRPDKLTRLLEGKYDDRKPSAAQNGGWSDEVVAKLKRAGQAQPPPTPAPQEAQP